MWCSIGATSSGRSGPVRAGNPGHQVALVPRAMTRLLRGVRALTIEARFGAPIGATICTSSDSPAITQSMLDLCSAPCKARRFAPPARTRGLRALTVPARRAAGASATPGTERRHNPRATTTERDQTRDTARALTEREVADMLGLSVATLRAWRHRGKGPRFLRLGRSVRYLPADVADFVRASAVDTTSVSSSDESEIGELPL
jgi:predicted DNA-binding transcriptional regulator AlpA